MDRIASFSVDHNKIDKGMYISRIDFDDIVSYDVRMKRPNRGDYLSPKAAHTIEHLLATFVRNSKHGTAVVYAGPMGCLTGMYFLAKRLPHQDAIDLMRGAMAFIRDFEGELPGSKEEECGNYRFHNLPEAKAVGADMAEVLNGWTVEDLTYRT